MYLAMQAEVKDTFPLKHSVHIRLAGNGDERLITKQRAQIIGSLVEGNSVRATCRMTGAAKGTVLKLLADTGRA